MRFYEDEEPGENNLFCPELNKKFLAVITTDGKLILDKHPYLTLLEVVEYVGVETVADLNLMVTEKLPFMSKTRITAQDYQPTDNGWFVYTTFKLKDKVAFIKKIGELTGNNFVCATKRMIKV